MSKYIVQVDWSGHCRGVSEYEVEADSEEEAMENWWKGKEINSYTIRDDTDKEATSAELIEEEK